LIIVAIPDLPNGTPASTPTLSNVTLLSGTFDGLLFTGGVNSANTLSSGQNVMDVLKLPGDSSQSYANYSKFDGTIPISVPTTFTLDVFAVSCALGSTACPGPINFDIEGFTNGTFVSAFACGVPVTGGAACPQSPQDNTGSTPFTTGGFVGVTPEPTSMLLFGTGLIALGAKLRRRKSV
jgi:hypothetical protein